MVAASAFFNIEAKFRYYLQLNNQYTHSLGVKGGKARFKGLITAVSKGGGEYKGEGCSYAHAPLLTLHPDSPPEQPSWGRRRGNLELPTHKCTLSWEMASRILKSEFKFAI